MLEPLFLRAALFVPLLLRASGCDGETSSTPATTTTTTDRCAEAGAEDHGVPELPEGAPRGEGPERLFAVRRFHLGVTTSGGEPSSMAWQEYGFNLDRTTTGPAPNGYCTCGPAAGAKLKQLIDAPEGRDNGFGKTHLPMLGSLMNDLEPKVNAEVKEGRFSWLFRMRGLGEGMAYSGLGAEVFEAAAYEPDAGGNVFPAFDGTDVWPVADAGLTASDPPAAMLTFEDAYLTPAEDGTSVWVGRGTGTIRLWVPFEPGGLRIVIHDPVLVLPLSADRSTITRGMLGGQVVIEELVAEVGRLMGYFVDIDGDDLCPPSATFDSLAQQIRQGADSLAGFALDQEATCDRASIGIAFDAASIAALGDVAPAIAVGDPCAAKP